MSTTVSEGLDSSNNITFLLNDVDLSGTLDVTATVLEGSTEDAMTGDVVLNGVISVTLLNDIFLFQTDASSIDDISSTDLKFKDILDTSNTNLFVSNVTDSTTESNPTITGGLKLSEEYVQFIALNVFGTRKGADIFDNEEALTTALDDDFGTSFTGYLTSVETTAETGYNEIDSGIGHKIFQTIMRLDGSRIDLSGNISDTTGFQPVPILVGDILAMRYTVKDSNNHASDLSNNSWDANNNERSYIIKLEVEA